MSGLQAEDCANPLFAQWIKEWEDQANKIHNENLARVYKRAYFSIVAYPVRLKSAKEAAALKGIGPKIVAKLEQKIADYLQNNGRSKLYSDDEQDYDATVGDLDSEIPTSQINNGAFPQSWSSHSKLTPTVTPTSPVVMTIMKDKPKKKANSSRPPRPYIPRYRSGAWGILLALYESHRPLSKMELCERAQRHCDDSYGATTSGNSNGHAGYSTNTGKAWSFMKRLEEKELVLKKGRPFMYELSEEGRLLAQKLSEATQKQPQTTIPQTEESDEDTDAPTQASSVSTLSTTLAVGTTEVFRYSYLTQAQTQTQTLNRSQAATECIGAIRLYKIRFQKSQSTHPLARNVGMVSPCPNDAEYLTGWIDESKADERATGLGDSATEPRTVTSVLSSSSGMSWSEDDDVTVTAISMNNIVGTSTTISNKNITASTSYTTIPPNQYTIHLVLDNREISSKMERSGFLRALRDRGVDALSRPLAVGDMLFIARIQTANGVVDVVLDFVVERKRLDDLVASIKDGRYKEQKTRLARCGVSNVIYLIEESSGQSEAATFGLDRVHSAMCGTQINSGFALKRTKDLDETVSYLRLLLETMKEKHRNTPLHVVFPHQLPQLVSGTNMTTELSNLRTQLGQHVYITLDTYESQNSKSKTLTMGDIFMKQLLCIRGLTVDKASAIAAKYPTWAALLQALEDVEHQAAFSDITSATSSLSSLSLEQDVASEKHLKQFDQTLVGRKKLGDKLVKRLWELVRMMDYTKTTSFGS